MIETRHIEAGVRVYHGDCRLVMPQLPDPDCSIDSVVTDPPYHLTTGKKGGTGAASLNENSPAGRSRVTTGFMGKAWDGGDVAHDPAVWRECLRLLKPGGHLLAFGGTRTYHRLACAIEDAGFEIRDDVDFWYDANPIFAAFYDSLTDAQKETLHASAGAPHLSWLYGSGFPKSLNLDGGIGTGLKPAHEPIVVARKPLIGTVKTNVAEFGTGGLRIEDCRVEGVAGNGHWSGDDGSDATSRPGYDGGFTKGGKARPLRVTAPLRDDYDYKGNALAGRVDGSLQTSKAAGETTLGRWPANVIHDGSDEVLAAFPDAPGQLRAVKGTEKPKQGTVAYGDYGPRTPYEPAADSGSAARFFYCAKASKEDRDEGLEDFVPQQRDDSRKEGNPGGDNPRNRGLALRANNHPTVKPTDLMRYLVRLVTPPGGTVLDPFCGSGSTGKACALEQMNAILIDSELEYCDLAAARSRLAQGLLAFG